jgi:hypothetical protein
MPHEQKMIMIHLLDIRESLRSVPVSASTHLSSKVLLPNTYTVWAYVAWNACRHTNTHILPLQAPVRPAIRTIMLAGIIQMCEKFWPSKSWWWPTMLAKLKLEV